ncbi:hypothetical protein [Burkholderia gladioli]|uniref:hypothetical protein n=1 Tax=Burkholderia gladioli TaxID=28095 RepID=UPI00163EA292|nr:hypothetical protein [Burkholderia gladioli]
MNALQRPDDFAIQPLVRRGEPRRRSEDAPVRGESFADGEPLMPRHVLNDEPRFCVVLELISSDVDDRSAQFKPRMGFVGTLAKHVIRAAITVLVKVLAKQEAGVAAAPVGELLQLGRKSTRIRVFNRTPKFSGESFYTIAFIVDETTGGVYFHRGYPFVDPGHDAELPGPAVEPGSVMEAR